MRAILFTVLLFLLTSPSYAGSLINPYILGAAAGGGCTTVATESTDISSAIFTTGKFTGELARAGLITTSASSQTVCAVDVWAEKVGAPTQTVTLYIYTDSGTEPTTPELAASSSVSATTFPSAGGGGDWVTFSLVTPVALSASTNYRLVLVMSSTDGTNHINVYGGSTAAADVDKSDAWPAVTWVDETNRQMAFRLKTL
jgi:hypothetical protein